MTDSLGWPLRRNSRSLSSPRRISGIATEEDASVVFGKGVQPGEWIGVRPIHRRPGEMFGVILLEGIRSGARQRYSLKRTSY